MKEGIHPEYRPIQVTCSCGHIFTTGSALCNNLNIEVCNKCHPFYTGKQKIIDTAGRVDKFAKRFGGFTVNKTQDDATDNKVQDEA